MSEMRPIPENDLTQFAWIVANAYPAFDLHSDEQIQRFVQRMADGLKNDPLALPYGLYRDGRLLGGMRLFDFSMNMFGTMIPVGGVGLVAVDLAHKKQKVAKEMIDFFLRHYRQRGAPLAALYPFRPDFYRQMGFGYGTKMHQYRVHPSALPAGGARERVRFLTQDDKPALADCYARYVAQTHGMMAKREAEVNALFDTAENRIVGYEQDGVLRGYMVFQFKKGKTFVQNDIEIRELISEARPALLGLMAFLQSQADQIQTVVINTQDEHFHHLLLDPRNGTGNLLPHVYHESNVSGVGIMYRVLDTPGLFTALRAHDFDGQSCRLKISTADSFLAENDGDVVVAFDEGRATVQDGGEHDVAIRLDVAAFSSLVMGVVPLSRLIDYGLAEISDPAYLPVVNRLFLSDEKPMCVTRF